MRLPIDLSRCEVPLDHYEGTIATSETEYIDEIVHNIASKLEGQQQQGTRVSKRGKGGTG